MLNILKLMVKYAQYIIWLHVTVPSAASTVRHYRDAWFEYLTDHGKVYEIVNRSNPSPLIWKHQSVLVRFCQIKHHPGPDPVNVLHGTSWKHRSHQEHAYKSTPEANTNCVRLHKWGNLCNIIYLHNIYQVLCLSTWITKNIQTTLCMH